MKYLNLVVTLLITNLAYADVNKCMDSKGKINFTDKPCAHGQSATTVKIKPTNIANGSGDRAAVYEIQRQQDRRITYRVEPPIEKDSITKGNEDRMHRVKSVLPNGLGTGRGCYWESNQYYCY